MFHTMNLSFLVGTVTRLIFYFRLKGLVRRVTFLTTKESFSFWRDLLRNQMWNKKHRKYTISCLIVCNEVIIRNKKQTSKGFLRQIMKQKSNVMKRNSLLRLGTHNFCLDVCCLSDSISLMSLTRAKCIVVVRSIGDIPETTINVIALRYRLLKHWGCYFCRQTKCNMFPFLMPLVNYLIAEICRISGDRSHLCILTLISPRGWE